MTPAEELVNVEIAEGFARQALPMTWRDWLVIFDHELSLFFGCAA